jgi:hypothetical protein
MDPNEYSTDHPTQVPGAGQTAGYIGVAAVGPSGALLPGQSREFDLMELAGAGVPVDGTTGAGQAGKGSRYIDVTNAQLYINGGTKAAPVWKIVTRAV